MRKILPLAMIAALIAVPAWSAPIDYTVVKEKSSLKFFAIQNSAPLEGRFTDYSAEIKFDSQKPEDSSISVTVKTGSLEISNPDAKANIKLPEWLSTEKFPEAVFKSDKVHRMPQSDNYFAEGKLTLKGKSVPIVVNFQLQDVGEAQIATGYATLRRADFNVGEGQWAKDDVIKNEVRVEFRIFAKKNS